MTAKREQFPERLRPSRRGLALAAALLLAACTKPPPSPQLPQQVKPQPTPAGPPTPPGPQPPVVEKAPEPEQPPPPATRVLLVDNGQETWTTAEKATAAGYTLVDLSDDWTPFLFAEHHTPTGEPLPNRYRRVFVGLANDQLDEDGQPLEPHEKNYLELYGVFPSLSVIRARFLQDGAATCDKPPKRHKGHKQPVVTPMAEAERRLACEGFLTPQSRHHAGKLDAAMQLALRSFQQKHMIYEGQALNPRTREALARPLVDNDHRSLMRALRERVVSAAAIIEDGTAERGGQPTFLAANGQRYPMRNLADEYTDAAAKQLGLGTPEEALAFMQRHSSLDFVRLIAAVKLPPLPEYYGPEMDLSVVIDRGDIWYDLPFDEEGQFKIKARKKFPQFMLYTTYRGQKIMLARWRTTIGGWRAEQASDGYEYFRYKGSDVGPRVIRRVVAGPVWIAPVSTPIRSLVKPKVVRGRHEWVVNYEELGPGYLSAYGLVAGYFVIPGVNGRPDQDKGIRAHGSSEYLSMYSAAGYSHGCHRLPNHIALRMYSFILRHRPMRIAGDQPMDTSRQFLRGDDAFEIRIPSGGYAYFLDPPLPVDVLEGDIRGEQKTPILTYVPKPGVRYPGPPPPVPNSPEARAGGVAPTAPAKKGGGPPRNPDEQQEQQEEEKP
jgi:hypothetical protein